MKYLTPHEVAEILQISYEKALAFIKYSGVNHNKIGNHYRVAEKALIAFLDNNREIDIGVGGESR